MLYAVREVPYLLHSVFVLHQLSSCFIVLLKKAIVR